MSVFLQFDKTKMVPAGTSEDWDAFTEWTSDCDDYAPDVLEFLENGESEQLPAITEQLALAHSCRPPESKRLNQHVVNVLKAIEESNAMRVDLLNDEPDESDFGEAIVSMSKSIADLTSQLAEQQKAHKADIQRMMAAVTAEKPQPAFNFTVPDVELKIAENPFGPAFEKGLSDSIRTMGETLANVITSAKSTVVNVDPTPITMPQPVLGIEESLITVFREIADRIIAAIGSIKLVVNVPKQEPPEPFDIAVTRDPDTGLATRFERVPKA